MYVCVCTFYVNLFLIFCHLPTLHFCLYKITKLLYASSLLNFVKNSIRKLSEKYFSDVGEGRPDEHANRVHYTGASALLYKKQ